MQKPVHRIFYLREKPIIYDDSPLYAKYAVVGWVNSLVRDLYRRIKYLFLTIGLSVIYILLVRPSKLNVILQMHLNDLSDAAKRDLSCE